MGVRGGKGGGLPPLRSIPYLVTYELFWRLMYCTPPPEGQNSTFARPRMTTTEQCEQMPVLFLSCSIVNYVKLQKAIGQILFLSFCTYLGTVRVPPTKRPPVVVTTEFFFKNYIQFGGRKVFSSTQNDPPLVPTGLE